MRFSSIVKGFFYSVGCALRSKLVIKPASAT